ncbi:MAG: hypothetical protein ACK5AW_06200 [Pseudanabaena sp.]
MVKAQATEFVATTRGKLSVFTGVVADVVVAVVVVLDAVGVETVQAVILLAIAITSAIDENLKTLFALNPDDDLVDEFIAILSFCHKE